VQKDQCNAPIPCHTLLLSRCLPVQFLLAPYRAGVEPVWRGYGTGMERVWSRVPPNPLLLRSSAGADTGEKSIKNN